MRRLRRCLPTVISVITVLLLAPLPGLAQRWSTSDILPAFGSGGQGISSQNHDSGGWGPFSSSTAQCDLPRSGLLPGSLSAGVDFASAGGVSLREGDLRFSIPIRLPRMAIGQLFVVAKTFGFDESPLTVDWATGLWRFGGFVGHQLGNGFYGGFSGSLDAVQRFGSWNLGGTGAMQFTQFGRGYQFVSFTVRYGVEAAGNIFPANTTGWEVLSEYSWGSSWNGPRAALQASAYSFDVGEKQQGYLVGASVSALGGVIRLTGRGGNDSVLGAQYRLGCSLNLGL
jgi:hypothetical protein